jgi:hypothetical protein
MFVPIANWLARYDVGSATGTLHETALDNARGRLLTLGAGLLAAGALLFTARTFALSREGQVTDRDTKAIEQLGSEKVDVRIGGIYALERIARDSARDHPAVIEVLTAFIREHSREQWPPLDPDNPDQARSTRPDVQAALTVIGRRDIKRDTLLIDLTGATLNFADFRFAILSLAKLTGAHLYGADLRLADLRHADLTNADLTNTKLTGADLRGATWPADTPVPEGWERRADSGQLRHGGTGPAPTEGADMQPRARPAWPLTPSAQSGRSPGVPS